MLALSTEFDDDLIIVLEEAPYFQSSTVTELAERDGINFVQSPPYSPDLNPLEEYWQQLKRQLRHRFFESQDQLKLAIQEALHSISTPNTNIYL